MAEITDREKLSIKIQSTIQYEFGSICDEVDRVVFDLRTAEVLKRCIRNRGNAAIRVINNHLDYVQVARNHRKDQINPHRVVQAAQEKAQ